MTISHSKSASIKVETRPNARMLFGDAKASIADVITSLKG